MRLSSFTCIFLLLLSLSGCGPRGRIISTTRQPVLLAMDELSPKTPVLPAEQDSSAASPNTEELSGTVNTGPQLSSRSIIPHLSVCKKQPDEKPARNIVRKPVSGLLQQPGLYHSSVKTTVRPDAAPTSGEKFLAFTLLVLSFMALMAGLALTFYWSFTATTVLAGIGIFLAGIIITSMICTLLLLPVAMMGLGRRYYAEPEPKDEDKSKKL